MPMSVKKVSLHNDIFRTLRERIIYMEYPPGMSLSEQALCEEFKVSRTPLREAVRKLEDLKLVTAIPRFGTFVAPIDINEVRNAFEVKTKLEGLAGALAARRITPEKLQEIRRLISEADNLQHRDVVKVDARFHEIIYQSAQNPVLEELLENLHSRCARVWVSTLSEVILVSDIVNQLRDLCIALEERDADKAERIMQAHVEYFITRIKTQLL
jgi:DNA-binding GntR family transcriptional regulator